MMDKETYEKIKANYRKIEEEISEIAMKNGGHTDFTQGMMYALDMFKQGLKNGKDGERNV